MGGGGNPIKTIGKVAGGITDAAIAATTLGTVKTNLKDGKADLKFSVDPKENLDNYVKGMTGGHVMESMMPTPPKMPGPINQTASQASANQAAEEKVKPKIDGGINSTLLGGSVSADDSNIKKKKLLGE
jgi:hypothetical protein